MADYQKNQGSIERQSTLKLVVEYCRLIGVPLKLKEIVRITNVLTDYCQNGYTTDIGKLLDSIDEHIAKKFED